MPFIDCKVSASLSEAQKDRVKTGLGKAVSCIGKTESYLMVGIADNYTLYMGGRKTENGAYVEVSLFGSASSSAYDKMTGEICRLLSSELSLDPSKIYITYHGVRDWGWNGSNF